MVGLRQPFFVPYFFDWWSRRTQGSLSKDEPAFRRGLSAAFLAALVAALSQQSKPDRFPHPWRLLSSSPRCLLIDRSGVCDRQEDCYCVSRSFQTLHRPGSQTWSRASSSLLEFGRAMPVSVSHRDSPLRRSWAPPRFEPVHWSTFRTIQAQKPLRDAILIACIADI